MALNANAISERVIRQLDDIGIDSRVGGRESETASLVRIIVGELVKALQREASVTTIVNGTCSTPSGPGVVTNATGRGGIS